VYQHLQTEITLIKVECSIIPPCTPPVSFNFPYFVANSCFLSIGGGGNNYGPGGKAIAK